MTAEHTSRCYCNCLACNAGRYDGNGHTSCAWGEGQVGA